MNRLFGCGLVWTMLLSQSGCTDSLSSTEEHKASGGKKPTPFEVHFEKRMLEIARTYESYDHGNVTMLIAIPQCTFDLTTPDGIFESREPVEVSTSGDASTHGKKLYLLFAKFPLPVAGRKMKLPKNPVGQAVVKEAWIPEEVEDTGKPLPLIRRQLKGVKPNHRVWHLETYVPYARTGGHLYHAKEKAGLFIMFKTDPNTPGTDEGWVYGTVTPDEKKVLSAGKVKSCMDCHRLAPYDRLFGLAKKK
jgi:hypothetical protein